MIDYTETLVLPRNELTNRTRTPRCAERDDETVADFDETLVLEDELAKRRLGRPA